MYFAPVILGACTNEHIASEGVKSDFGYNGVSRNTGFSLDAGGHSVVLGDVAIPASYCDVSTKFYCVNSDVFYFAVPKLVDESTKNWNESGHEYNVVTPLHRTKFLGREVSMMVIATQGPKDIDKPAPSDFFFYSPEDGLLAIVSIVSGDANPHISVSADFPGFGSQKR